jgi:hypothetical protein
MEPKVRIDPDEVEALAEDLERPLEPRDEAGREGAWTDGFRASGSKHAFM